MTRTAAEKDKRIAELERHLAEAQDALIRVADELSARAAPGLYLDARRIVAHNVYLTCEVERLTELVSK